MSVTLLINISLVRRFISVPVQLYDFYDMCMHFMKDSNLDTDSVGDTSNKEALHL